MDQCSVSEYTKIIRKQRGKPALNQHKQENKIHREIMEKERENLSDINDLHLCFFFNR